MWSPPQLTRFRVGHDARIKAESGDANATTLDISLEFNVLMNCDKVTASILFNISSYGKGGSPLVTSVSCGEVVNPDPTIILGAGTSS